MISNFEKEIFEQPVILERFLDTSTQAIEQIAHRLQSNPPRCVYIAARGTSDNAAIYAKYAFGTINRVPVALAAPSMFTLYKQPPRLNGCLVVGISQSGQSPDIQAVLDEGKRQGAVTLVITNDETSPLARSAKFVIPLQAGGEKSVAASKTYTASLAAIAKLAAHWSGETHLIENLARVPRLAVDTIEQHQLVREIARQLSDQERLLVIGRGFDYCTLHEIALKIKELAYVFALAYSAADFLHGPIAMVEAGVPVLAVAVEGATLQPLKDLIREIRSLQVKLVVITNDTELLLNTEMSIQLPAGLPEWLSPIVSVIPGQLLALHLALYKGHDPDNPRALRKITRTF